MSATASSTFPCVERNTDGNPSIKTLCELVDQMNGLTNQASKLSAKEQIESGLCEEGSCLYHSILNECRRLVCAPEKS